MTENMIEELAKELTEVYFILDPYGAMGDLESKEECIKENEKILEEWTVDEIKESIIDHLKDCIKDGIVEGDEAKRVSDLISGLYDFIVIRLCRQIRSMLDDFTEMWEGKKDEKQVQ